MNTRSQPEFQNQAQLELWTVRRKHAMLAGIPIDEEYEESYVTSLTSEEASAKTAIAEKAYDTFAKKQAKKNTKTGKQTSPSGAVDTPEPETEPGESAAPGNDDNGLSGKPDDND